MLLSDRVFKVGSSVKADLTRLRKQLPQLDAQFGHFTVVDLKEHCISRRIIKRGESGSLETLLEKSTRQYLPKDEQFRKCDDWECPHLSAGLINYAVMDVYASRLIFQAATQLTSIIQIDFNTAPKTRVTLFAQEGGGPIAYGYISDPQPTSFGSIRIKTSTRSRLLVTIDTITVPSAIALLHKPRQQDDSVHVRLTGASKTKANSLTLHQMQDALGPPELLQIVSPLNLLQLDCRNLNKGANEEEVVSLPTDVTIFHSYQPYVICRITTLIPVFVALG